MTQIISTKNKSNKLKTLKSNKLKTLKSKKHTKKVLNRKPLNKEMSKSQFKMMLKKLKEKQNKKEKQYIKLYKQLSKNNKDFKNLDNFQKHAYIKHMKNNKGKEYLNLLECEIQKCNKVYEKLKPIRNSCKNTKTLIKHIQCIETKNNAKNYDKLTDELLKCGDINCTKELDMLYKYK
jgi:hypothetical protein